MTTQKKVSKSKVAITLDAIQNLESQFLGYESAPSSFDKGAVEAQYKKHCKKAIYPKDHLSKNDEEFLFASYMQWAVNEDLDALEALDNAICSLSESVLVPYTDNCKSYYDFEKAYCPDNFSELLVDLIHIMDPVNPKLSHESDFSLLSSLGGDIGLFMPCVFAIPPSFSYIVARVTKNAVTKNNEDFLRDIRIEISNEIENNLALLWNDREYRLPSGVPIKNIILDILSSAFSPYGSNYEDDPIVYGMPGEVAFRIANCFYYGDGVRTNKYIAKAWFSYGAAVGDIKCLMAYLLYYCQSNLDTEDCIFWSASHIGALLSLSFIDAISIFVSDDTAKLLAVPKATAKDDKVVINTLYNLLAFTNEIAFAHDFNVRPFSYINEIFSEFYSLFFYIIKNTRPNDRLISAMAHFILVTQIEFDGEDEFEDEFINELLKLLGIRISKKNDNIDKIRALIEHGIKKGDLYSHIANVDVCSKAKEPLESMNKNWLQFLSDAGFADITYLLGNIKLNGGDATKSLPYWKKAAANGDGNAMFNLALNNFLKGNSKEAINYAQKAVDYGVVHAYFLLYKAYLESNEQLAYTYLRYASEYLFPDAIHEYKRVKEEGLYNPLPFMQAIEEIEELSKTCGEACLVMCDIYSQDCILPSNFAKSFDYQRRTVELGHVAFYPFYVNMYKHSFPIEKDSYSTFTSYRDSLRFDNEEFLFYTGQSDNEISILNNLIIKLFDGLIKGKTPFEKEILLGVYKTRFWNDIAHHTERLPRSINKKSSKCITYLLKKRLLEGIYTVIRNFRYEGLLDDEDKLENAYNYLFNLKKQGIEDSLDTVLARGFLAVRSFSQKANYKLFKKCMLTARNAGSSTGSIFNLLDFEMLFDDLADQDCVDSFDKIDDTYDPEVFISQVDQ